MTSGMKAGDEAAFDRFHETFAGPLHHYLLVRSRGREDIARDALQETLLRVIRYVRPFEKDGDFWNWVRRLARTALIDQWRRLSRSRVATATPPPDPEVPAGGDDATSVLLEHLEAALELLEGGERRLVSGKYLEGKSMKELAREESTTPKAVESRLVRARRKLRNIILERMKNDPRP